MKSTVVPAQVTTVEDRIMGNLGFSQLILLITPLFIGAGLYVLLPPFMSESHYKYIVIGVVALSCCVLSIRVKGVILARWLTVILRYALRPQYYLFNKNTAIYREDYTARIRSAEASTPLDVPDADRLTAERLNFTDTARALATLDDPTLQVQFETTKKGGLHVRLSEIQEARK